MPAGVASLAVPALVEMLIADGDELTLSRGALAENTFCLVRETADYE